MVLGGPCPSEHDLTAVGDEIPEQVTVMPILGALIDADLTLQEFVDQALGRLVAESLALIASMRDHGLGLPHQVTALALRVEASALYSFELCASASMGWPAVAKRLNATQYLILKQVLESEGVSFGTGGRHRVMMALGISQRLSTRVAIRIVCTHARILSLPCTNPVYSAIVGARAVTGVTWLDDALLVARSLGITEENDFLHWPRTRQLLNSGIPDAAAIAVRAWGL